MENSLHLVLRSGLWAIAPHAIYEAVSLAKRGPVAGAWEASKPTMRGKTGSKLAVIPIQGVLTKDGPSWYGSSYDSITRAVESAAADPDVKRIVLAVDSPGGNVQGCAETAAAIALAAKTKPVHAMVEGDAASAAFWLTSQASDITVTPTGNVGSVGVRVMHVDISQALENEGVKVTEMHAGDFKTEWSPYQPLSEAAQEHMQGRLDKMHSDFQAAVASGRAGRATSDIISNRFGEGRMFSAEEAMGHGLADKIQAPNDFYRAIMPPQEQEATKPPTFPIHLTRALLTIERNRF